MNEIVLAADDVAALQARLAAGQDEACAILYTSQTVRGGQTTRLLVREVEFPAEDDYARRSAYGAELRPEFVARVTKRGRRDEYGLVFVHSHLGTEAPLFSSVDTRGEAALAAFLAHRHPQLIHAAVVISEGGVRARQLGTDTPIRVVSLGPVRDVLFDPAPASPPLSQVFDRQVRAFGSVGQQMLQHLRVAIVGLGGTGSLIAQQLAYLGVRQFILIDPDILESTNLNRVVTARPEDVGQPKVDVAARYIGSLAQDASVLRMQGDVIRASVAYELVNADFIFGCTDSHGSRAVLQQLSYQYLIPCIDMGNTIVVEDGRVAYIYGRVQLLAPGLACFTCSGLLDPSQVRRDMMTAFERQADPYLQGAHEPAPAVISLNGTVASLAVTMLLAVVTGIPVPARHLLYNALSSTLRTVRAQPQTGCYICSRSGALARGDAWPLMARQD